MFQVTHTLSKQTQTSTRAELYNSCSMQRCIQTLFYYHVSHSPQINFSPHIIVSPTRDASIGDKEETQGQRNQSSRHLMKWDIITLVFYFKVVPLMFYSSCIINSLTCCVYYLGNNSALVSCLFTLLIKSTAWISDTDIRAFLIPNSKPVKGRKCDHLKELKELLKRTRC